MIGIFLSRLLLRSARIFRSSVFPLSHNEDSRRREFILNILLLGTLFLSFTATIIATGTYLYDNKSYSGIPPWILILISFVFVGLYRLSRIGYWQMASYIFITLYAIPTTYGLAIWSVYLPQPLLTFALLIVMAGVLMNTKGAIITASILSLMLFSIGYLQQSSVIPTNMSWALIKTPRLIDVMLFVITLLIITIVSWLSNREIERSLKKAWISEQELKKERDHLELAVEERTRELKQAQLEKMFQMYRFVEFGRLASGFFHDMTHPLTAVSLNLEALKAAHASNEVDQAIAGAKKMGAYVRAIRKQLQKQTITTTFSLDREVDDVLSVMGAKAREARVLFIFEKVKTNVYGSPLRFNQLITNLVSNAIDSYEEIDRRKNRVVHIILKKKDKKIYITITDHGVGIPKGIEDKVFDPFVTTKLEKGMGLGLSVCKTIVTTEYHGTIAFKSEPGVGTTFMIEFPIEKKKV